LKWLQILIVLTLLWIIMQDFRYRAVYWFLFPLLAVSLFVYKTLLWQSILTPATDVLYNMGFLFAQLFLLSAYFSFRQKRWVNITRELLGWGDILFLTSVAFYCGALTYVAFYVGSLFSVVVIWVIWKAVASKEKQIPLAGLQALLFCVLFVFGQYADRLHFTSDNWILMQIGL
jgi:hypothetical protein